MSGFIGIEVLNLKAERPNSVLLCESKEDIFCFPERWSDSTCCRKIPLNQTNQWVGPIPELNTTVAHRRVLPYLFWLPSNATCNNINQEYIDYRLTEQALEGPYYM